MVWVLFLRSPCQWLMRMPNPRLPISKGVHGARAPCSARISAPSCIGSAADFGSVTSRWPSGERSWLLGANLTTDLGPHRVRLDAGANFGHLCLLLIADPEVALDNKSQDLDLLAQWSFRDDQWAPFVGWRTSSVSIDRGRQWQENLLLGASGKLPSVVTNRIQGRFGLELIFTIVRHGEGFEPEWFSIASDRHRRDLVSIDLFLRFDYVSPIHRNTDARRVARR